MKWQNNQQAIYKCRTYPNSHVDLKKSQNDKNIHRIKTVTKLASGSYFIFLNESDASLKQQLFSFCISINGNRVYGRPDRNKNHQLKPTVWAKGLAMDPKLSEHLLIWSLWHFDLVLYRPKLWSIFNAIYGCMHHVFLYALSNMK